jgi:outer membrane receptor protein involved in Fe transport
VSQAQVQLRTNATSYLTTTDVEGDFAFHIAQSSGTLTVRAQGFSPASLSWSASSQPVIVQLKAAAPGETVVVTAERNAIPIAQTAANVISLDPAELQSRSAITLDDALRQAPGFTLFRRSNSLTANPTTQGASVRGVGASGASRVLVLDDGIPLNDPFGGWVYWDRTPRIALERAEVLRGGGANLYGSGALGGVVDLFTRPTDDLATVQALGDSLSGHDIEGALSHRFGSWTLSANGETEGSDGAFVVAAGDRGLVDTRANLKFSNGSLRAERKIGADSRVFAAGSLFTEKRNNGTALQVNSTHLGTLTAGADATEGKNLFAFRVYGQGEHYHQSFSAIAPDRNSENLVRWQTVPSDQIGFSAQWSRLLGSAQASAGVDGRFVHGESDETPFSSGLATSLVSAGGRSNLMGIFGELSAPISRRLRASAGLRVDWWDNEDAFNRAVPITSGAANFLQLASHSESAISPRGGLVYDLANAWQLTATAYGGFRAPTLNELYRGFRLGNVLTLPNEALTAEHLQGGEAGVRYVRRRVMVSGTFFEENVDNPVGNVTQSVTPSLITRQRDNIGSLRARGADADLLLTLSRVQLRAGYEYVHSMVTSFSADPALVGNIVPQVPANVVSVSGVYNAPQHWTVAALLRAASQQFDDDLNQFPLEPYSVAGVSVSRQTGMLTWIGSVSNLFDSRIQTTATPVLNYASPRIISAGVRFSSPLR